MSEDIEGVIPFLRIKGRNIAPTADPTLRKSLVAL